MELRRPIAAVLTALALVGGGATVTGCASSSGGATSDQRNDGVDDTSKNTAGNDPAGNSQNRLPNNSDPERDGESRQDQDGGQP